MNESVRFDRAVDFYDQTRGFPPGEEQPIAALICRVGGFNEASRVLEIGVGTGRIALPVARHVGAYFGVDLSASMMQRLKAKRRGEAVYPGQADAAWLPFPARSFDGVVAVHVFHLIPAWRQVLDEVRRVLRSGAPLVHCWTRDDDAFRKLGEAWRAVVSPERQADVGVHWKRNPEFLLDEGWQAAGAEHSHAYSVERAPLDMLDGLRNRIWSATWRLTDEEVERGMDAMRAVIAADYPNPDAPRRLQTTFVTRAYLPPAEEPPGRPF
ncbi:MAG: class I SAM-dependent methyltransferase [Chloroflexi bacterium]|nr:class I SAM-dependent methyltransferase [Chloroflexota bacterium]